MVRRKTTSKNVAVKNADKKNAKNKADEEIVDYMAHSVMHEKPKKAQEESAQSDSFCDALETSVKINRVGNKSRSVTTKAQQSNWNTAEQHKKSAEMMYGICGGSNQTKHDSYQKDSANDTANRECSTNENDGNLYISESQNDQGSDDSESSDSERDKNLSNDNQSIGQRAWSRIQPSVKQKLFLSNKKQTQNAKAPPTEQKNHIAKSKNRKSERKLSRVHSGTSFSVSSQYCYVRDPGVIATSVFRRFDDTKAQHTFEKMVREKWDQNSDLENADDCGTQPVCGSAVCKHTTSKDICKRDYTVYGINSYFKDSTFDHDKKLEEIVMGVAMRNMCREGDDQDEIDERDLLKAEQQLASANMGKALVNVTSLCINAAERKQMARENANQTGLGAMAFPYPQQTDLRCSYDHHRFTNVPILIPLAFCDDPDYICCLVPLVFCSFSCALGWISERAPSMLRSQNICAMLQSFARRYFAVTGEIKLPAKLTEHEDYGGPHNTAQWRAKCTTHRSMLRVPYCVATPSTVVNEVYVKSRKHIGDVGKIVRRTEETHFNTVAERPERHSGDSSSAADRKKKEGKGRPLKERQIKVAGKLMALDDQMVENIIEHGNKVRQERADNAQFSMQSVIRKDKRAKPKSKAQNDQAKNDLQHEQANKKDTRRSTNDETKNRKRKRVTNEPKETPAEPIVSPKIVQTQTVEQSQAQKESSPPKKKQKLDKKPKSPAKATRARTRRTRSRTENNLDGSGRGALDNSGREAKRQSSSKMFASIGLQ